MQFIFIIATNIGKSILKLNCFSSIASKPLNIWWIRTDSKPYLKIMHSIELQTIFKNIKMKILKSIAVLLPRACGPLGLKNLHFNRFKVSGKLCIGQNTSFLCDVYPRKSTNLNTLIRRKSKHLTSKSNHRLTK